MYVSQGDKNLRSYEMDDSYPFVLNPFNYLLSLKIKTRTKRKTKKKVKNTKSKKFLSTDMINLLIKKLLKTYVFAH